MYDNNSLDDTIQNDLDKRNRRPDGPVKRKLKNEAKKQLKKQAKKAKKKVQKTLFKSVSLTTGIGILPIFIIIFMIIGIISFITSMPGLVQESIMNKVTAGVKAISAALNGTDYYLKELLNDTNRTKQKDILKYLDDMGIDPVGFGFAAFYTRNANTDQVDYTPSLEDKDFGDVTGLFSAIKYNNKLKEDIAKEDLIFKYIISNERTYLVDEFDAIGNWGIVEAVKKCFSNYDFKGMIKTGIKGIDDSNISIDREKKVMKISSMNWTEFAQQSATYNIDSWAGRYGMPLEFLLALHIATMTSDLTEEMITNPNLNTEVKVDTQKQDYKVDYNIKYTKDGKQIELPKRGSVIDDLDDLDDYGEEYVYIDENGKYAIDLSEEDIEYIKNHLSISSLYGWIQELQSFMYNDNADPEGKDAITHEAIKALLGDDEFRVVLRFVTGRNPDNSSGGLMRWTSYLGKAKKSGEKYSCELSKTLKKRLDKWSYQDREDGSGGTYYMSSGEQIGEQIYINNETGKIDLNNVKNSAPSSDSQGKVNNLQGNRFYTEIIHGLQYYIQEEHTSELLNDEATKMGIAAILSQIDQYYFVYLEDTKQLNENSGFKQYITYKRRRKLGVKRRFSYKYAFSLWFKPEIGEPHQQINHLGFISLKNGLNYKEKLNQTN